jgi:predicted Na+-dependent transporter
MGEAVIWLTCSLIYFWKAGKARPFHWVYLGVAIAFLYFGLADAVEYLTAGALPWWLWTWKISGGLILFGLLVTEDYVKRGPVALAPYRFIAAGAILAGALACILWERA